MDSQLYNADAVVLVFDITNPSSIRYAEGLYKNIHSFLKKEVVVCLLGNKADIRKSGFDIEVNKYLFNLVKNNGFLYGETSIFFDSNTIYKEIIFFNHELLQEESFREFLTQEDKGDSPQSNGKNENKDSGYIIYNQIESGTENKRSAQDNYQQKEKTFQNNIFYNAGIMVIVEGIIDVVRNRKSIDIRSINRGDSGSIKLSSARVSSCCSCK